MKMRHFLIALVLWGFFAVCFGGCGREETPMQYFDLQIEQKQFYDVTASNEGGYASFLNMQFYQDEPVQIWAVYDGIGSMDVYLYRIDGNRELLLENLSGEYVQGGGYIDREGNYYYWAVNQGNIIKLDQFGKQLFSRQLSDLGVFKIEKLCQLDDGRVYARCAENGQGGPDKLYEMDPATGEITKIENGISELYIDTYIAAGGDGLLYLKNAGVMKVDVKEGTQTDVWSFSGTSFALEDDNQFYPVWDFRIQEDGKFEILQAVDRPHDKGTNGVAKTLQKIGVEEGREIVVLRGICFTYDTWLKECVRRFNQTNTEWYVVLQECASGTDMDIQENYARRTSVEMAAGEGPDILYEGVLKDYTYGVFQKGGFADLSPYLESSGIKKEDYFPCVFGCWQDDGKIYSVTASVSFSVTGYGGILMDAAVLGQSEEPDIKTLVDALLAWQGDAVFLQRTDSQGVLERFLRGTEDLWGMVDWEKGRCDFKTELFAGILEVARRYGGTGENDAPPIAEEEHYVLDRYMDSGRMKEMGKVRVGILFDDGCHACVSDERTLMINANSDKKDGAGEFIRFLLEEGQSKKEDAFIYPASREVFDAVTENTLANKLYEDAEIYNKWNDTMIYFYSLTKERIAEIKEILEDARFAPIRTKPILDIIYEEASGYFNGTKGVDETIDVINNRVQVYLDEGAAQ